jgi:transcriptional regulator of acetoin/glycerol metabolism
MYSWPGNVRELENVLGNACMMVEGNLIDIDDLPERLRSLETLEEANALSLEAVQRRHITKVLDGVGGDKLRAAQILGVSRSFLYKFERRRFEIIEDERA